MYPQRDTGFIHKEIKYVSTKRYRVYTKQYRDTHNSTRPFVLPFTVSTRPFGQNTESWVECKEIQGVSTKRYRSSVSTKRTSVYQQRNTGCIHKEIQGVSTKRYRVYLQRDTACIHKGYLFSDDLYLLNQVNLKLFRL